MEKPMFKHDCITCIFLGRFKNHDLYFHPPQSIYPTLFTLVARYDNDGQDYTSGCAFAEKDTCLFLYEASLRAEKKGLINKHGSDSYFKWTSNIFIDK